MRGHWRIAGRDGRCQCRRFCRSRAKRIRTGIVLCRRRRGRIAVVDVLESGDHDADARPAERVGAVRHYSLFRQHARPRAPCSARLGGTGDTGNDALVPSGYYSWQVNPQLWLGLSVNSPFGLSVSFPDAWAGRNYAGDTKLKTYNATPSFAYKINDMISIGAGVQIQYAKADLATGIHRRTLRRIGASWARESGQHRRPRLGLRLHRRRHIDADADHHHRARLSFRHQPEDQGHVDASAGPACCRVFDARRCRNHARSARCRQPRLAAAVDAAVDADGDGRVVELEPHRHLDGDQSNGSPARVRDTGHCHSNTRRLVLVGRRRIPVERPAWRCAAASASTKRRSAIRCARRCLPDNDRTWLSVGATYQVDQEAVLRCRLFAYVREGHADRHFGGSGNPWYDRRHRPISATSARMSTSSRWR